MHHKTKGRLTFLKRCFIALFVLVMLVLVAGQLLWPAPKNPEQRYGITYSSLYAEQLGLEPVEAYERILNTLKVDLVRIPVYWNRVEEVNNIYDWEEVDQLMEISRRHEVDVVLAIGRKVPRWPECFIPHWAASAEQEILRQEQLAFVRDVVDRYKLDDSLVRWQVENEPYFGAFGHCPRVDEALIQNELLVVRGLDPVHPIMTGVSGEQSLWARVSKWTDIVGTTLYRDIDSPIVGYVHLPIPSWTYRMKADIFSKKPVVIAELQAEPWFSRPISTYTISQQVALFDDVRLRQNASYAKQVGFSEVYFWGVEWWEYLRVHGEGLLMEEAVRLFNDGV